MRTLSRQQIAIIPPCLSHFGEKGRKLNHEFSPLLTFIHACCDRSEGQGRIRTPLDCVSPLISLQSGQDLVQIVRGCRSLIINFVTNARRCVIEFFVSDFYFGGQLLCIGLCDKTEMTLTAPKPASGHLISHS